MAEERRGKERHWAARRCHKFVEKEAGTVRQVRAGGGLAWNRASFARCHRSVSFWSFHFFAEFR
jgi:hypothetical protein